MISTNYREAILEIKIKDFIKSFKRVPVEAEIIQMKLDIESTYSDVDNVGISLYDLSMIDTYQPASAELENSNRNLLKQDLSVCQEKIKESIELTESWHKYIYSSILREQELLRGIDYRLSNILFSNSQSTAFVFFIEESFDDCNKVIVDETTALVDKGGVSLGTNTLKRVTIASSGLSIETPQGSLNKYISGNLTKMVNIGDSFKAEVETKYQTGPVDYLITLKIPKKESISYITIENDLLSKNKLDIYISKNQDEYVPINPTNIILDKTYSKIVINEKDLVGLLLKFKQTEATVLDTTNKYVLSLKSIKCYSTENALRTRSQAILGPYSLLNNVGVPIYFSKLQISACAQEPTGTGISMSVSNDKDIWHNVDYKNNNTISFNKSIDLSLLTAIDETKDFSALIVKPNLGETQGKDEAYLNVMVPMNKVVPETINIKRNIESSEEVVLNSAPGWIYDSETGTYTTTCLVNNVSGINIDIGNTNLVLDGKIISGIVFLSPGEHTIKTTDLYWSTLDIVHSEDELRAIDNLYPHNHRYLFEGYNYPRNFVGAKAYNGCDKIYGKTLKYLSDDEFLFLDPKDELYFSCFTLEEVDGSYLIKVKIDRTSSTWLLEKYELGIYTIDSSSRNFYVKVNLFSSAKESTPILESFKVRGI
jgi:hypothetical protein